jgi:parallel beta-helix repeat protein
MNYRIMERYHAIALCVLLLSTVFFTTDGAGQVLHVDAVRGNDMFPGTEAQPFKTIGKASMIAEPGDTILIREGTYHEQLYRGRSGRPDAPITYAGMDRGRVVLQGSVRVKDWQEKGDAWVKHGLAPITHVNAFVMVDEKRLLQKVGSPVGLPEGSFHLSADGTYTIRLWRDASPNSDHQVDVYELDFAFNSGQRWGGTAKKHIVLKNMTLEKYGATAISTDAVHAADNSHWELDHLTIRYNNAEGVFYCLDGWQVHDCAFIRNRGHGCQLNGSGIRFGRNLCAENLWFGPYPDGGCGLLIGPDALAHSCVIADNVFENNGGPAGYGCGIYLEGRSHDNLIENNLIIGGSHSGIGFFGSSRNTVINNVLVRVAPSQQWRMSAAFVISHSHEGEPTQSVGNLVAHNTVWGCPAPLAIDKPARALNPGEANRFYNNFFGSCRFLSSADAGSVFTMQGTGCYSCPQDPRTLSDAVRAAAHGMSGGQELPHFCDPPLGRTFLVDPGLQDHTAYDFRLKEDSPLIGAGVPLPEVIRDRAGVVRPEGRRPAIGAYEYLEK